MCSPWLHCTEVEVGQEVCSLPGVYICAGEDHYCTDPSLLCPQPPGLQIQSPAWHNVT